ncbi:aminotransferase class IV family protein [Ostreiculturibacter nitratireducens]|uniref:aminotransferase class IV family protein n=1 Tax=Ostreiculturibacter nitratireducens TaxID=3075226 RepID=UPI0031B622E0
MEIPLRPDGVRLIETFGWDGTRFARLDRHLARARAGAARLGFAWNDDAVTSALSGIGGPEPLRVRLTVGASGDAEATVATLAPAASLWRVAVAADRLSSDDPWLRLKTTRRALYDRSRAALPTGIDEFLFLNERDELCEGTITNIFFDLGEGLMTPPLASGCLPGILRAELVETGRCREAALHAKDMPRARLWVGNALRGLIAAELSG